MNQQKQMYWNQSFVSCLPGGGGRTGGSLDLGVVSSIDMDLSRSLNRVTAYNTELLESIKVKLSKAYLLIT